jgi:hypothetical protein
LIAFAIWWLWSYRITEYRGDGKITDAGTWNYPRYRIELSQIPFFESSVHQFKLAGLSSGQMTLTLDVVGKTEKNRVELTRLKTRIEATLLDDEGRTVCKAFGIPSDGTRENAWILSSSDISAAFYNQSCVDIDIHRSRSYTLAVRLIEVDPDSPRAYLVPILSGGGNELP